MFILIRDESFYKKIMKVHATKMKVLNKMKIIQLMYFILIEFMIFLQWV